MRSLPFAALALLAAWACARPAKVRPAAIRPAEVRPVAARPAAPRPATPRPFVPPRVERTREERRSPAPRFAGALAVLQDGRVLATGGGDNLLRSPLAYADFYDPAANSWTAAPSLRHGRHMHTATTLRDGRVLVAGGRRNEGDPVLGTELYDPAANRWSDAGDIPRGRWSHRAVLLSDGRVLVAGGARGQDRNSEACDLYDPRTGRWTEAAPMRRPRTSFAIMALADGRVLVAGGAQDGRTILADAELYDPSRDAWSPAEPMAKPRFAPAFIALPDGRVLVSGGAQGHVAHADAEIFDPKAGTWSPAGRMTRGRYLHALARVGDSIMAVAGADPALGELDDSEFFDLASLSWRPGPRLSASYAHLDAVPTKAGALVASGRRNGLPLADPFLAVRHGDAGTSPTPGPPAAYARPAEPAPAPARARAAPWRGPTRPPRPDDYAVVIGVERYKSLPSADFAENDAARFSEALQALGVPEENIVTLTGERASLAGLTKYADEWLARRATPASRVWFFYSGHGAPDAKDGMPFLMPWDADAAFVKSTGFPLKRLYDALAALPAREVVAVLDACFTGVGERSVLAPGLRPLVAARVPDAPRRLTVLAASSPDEAAGSLPSAGHGMFTHYLLEGLAGAADADGDGHATVAEVHGYARRKVIVEARKLDREQTPTLSAPDPKLRLW